MDLSNILNDAASKAMRALGEGKVATYIPALARVDPSKFGLAVATVAGDEAQVGDAREPFSIQSVSKVFTLALALDRLGGGLWRRVGREPSGNPFNSIVQLEQEAGVPRNPFINAGAIVVADVVLGNGEPGPVVNDILVRVRGLANSGAVTVDLEVARSEAETGHRNRALASFMKAHGNLHRDVSDVLDVYFHQCALAMTCKELARATLFLANGGVDPLTGQIVTSAQRARRINSLMLTCGHYDASGDFAFRVGLPGKSGVGGGIVIVAPGHGTLCAWAPELNTNGNSLAGSIALEHAAAGLGWSVFGM